MQSQSVLSSICGNCHRIIPFSPVKSNANGNQGRLLARCKSTNPATGVQCDHWDWLPGSPSPSLLPTAFASQFNQEPAHLVAPVSLPVPLTGVGDATRVMASAPAKVCTRVGCRVTRIRRDCSNGMCKAHCKDAITVCKDAAHRKTQRTAAIYGTETSPAFAPAFMQPASPTLAPSNMPTLADPLHLPVAASQAQAGPPLPSSSAPQPPSQAGPVYYSHITPVFTMQMAREEEMREANRRREATRLQSKQKVQQTVFVYAWMEEGVTPVPFEIQEGFVWPNFILSEAVLSMAGFTVSSGLQFNLFRHNLCYWTVVRVGHVVEVKDNPRIFIKATHVTCCQDFTQFLISPSASSPNIRRNLPGERAFIKKKMVEHELSQSSASVEKQKYKLSSIHFPSTSKRRRVSSASEASLSPDELESPTMVHRPVQRLRLARPDSTPTPTLPSTSGPSKAAVPFLTAEGNDSKSPKWPRQFFAVDIVKCFEEIEDGDSDEKVCSIFEQYFGEWAAYKRATFYEHRQRWQKASADVKQAVLAAGHTEAGCWSRLMAATPAFRAELKASRKRRPHTVAVGGVIEISDGEA